MIIDLSRCLGELGSHDIGRHLLAAATPAQLARVAALIAQDESSGLTRALGMVAERLGMPDPRAFAEQHLEHLLWCEHRKALWSSGLLCDPADLGCSLRYTGKRNLRASEGSPTILISPMVLAYEDALWIVKEMLGSRPAVVYGEGLSANGAFARVSAVTDLAGLQLVDSSLSAMRKILATLGSGGVLVTYPDFVYKEHKALSAPMLGVPWPFSRSFVSLCARHGTMLLPCCPVRNGKAISVHCETPVQVDSPQGRQVDQRWSLQLTGVTVARLLEVMILRNPAQWALLATVIGQCEQRAGA